MQLLPSVSWQCASVAYGINDSGVIVGAVIDGTGSLHAAEWIPVPSPVIVSVLIGIIGLMRIRRPAPRR